jgi:hypothetical protein
MPAANRPMIRIPEAANAASKCPAFSNRLIYRIFTPALTDARHQAEK